MRYFPCPGVGGAYSLETLSGVGNDDRCAEQIRGAKGRDHIVIAHSGHLSNIVSVPFYVQLDFLCVCVCGFVVAAVFVVAVIVLVLVAAATAASVCC